MKWLDLTLQKPAENLALDEVLLDLAEEGACGETLRFWEPMDYFVVLGYSNPLETEVHVPFCRQAGIGLFRRTSGGGTVLQGPGCLNYSLILDPASRPELRGITQSNRAVMEINRGALASVLNREVLVRGHTDLTLADHKFSGNAQRRKKRFFLFHGTFLLHFDLGMIEKTLRFPSREPDYRGGRRHLDFLTNLSIPASAVKEALRNAWAAQTPFGPVPQERVRQLAESVYSSEAWTTKF